MILGSHTCYKGSDDYSSKQLHLIIGDAYFSRTTCMKKYKKFDL